MASYRLEQKAFVFSMISNAAANIEKATVPDLEAAVVKRFNTVTSENTQYLGAGWELVWGPAVHEQSDSGVADNTVFVTRGTDGGKPVYIVPIAGTNAKSAFDINVEDLEVAMLKPFSDDGAKIAQGTHTGVDILETLRFKGATLQRYLAGVADQEATLIFTGHSLGGALSPTLALDLAVNLGFDLSKWAAVRVYPTAGPTPGNKKFVGLFQQTFPATGPWNRNVINSIDVVPRAWNRLTTIRQTYSPDLKGSECIRALVAALQVNRGFINKYDNLPEAPFTGQYNSTLKGVTYPEDPSVQFAVQAFYQHIAAYTAALIPEFRTVFDGGSLPAQSTDSIHEKCKGVK
jgi:hypothetical protein